MKNSKSEKIIVKGYIETQHNGLQQWKFKKMGFIKKAPAFWRRIIKAGA